MSTPDASRAPERGPLLTRAQLAVVILAVLATIASVLALVDVLPPAVRASDPDRPVRAYLQAIAAGRITEALRLGHITPGATDKLLTDAAYGQSSDRVTAFTILGTRLTGASGVVEAQIRQGDSSYDADFRITRGGGFGPLSAWSLAPQKLPEITLALPASLDLRLSIGGVDFTTSRGEITQRVFPGSYETTPRTTAQVDVGHATATATFAMTKPTAVAVPIGIADSATAEAKSLVTAWVTQCAASSELHPSGCPFHAVPQASVSYSDGRWTIQAQPVFGVGEWNAQLGGWPVTTSVPGYVSFTAHAAEGDLTGTASTGSNPFSVAGTLVPDSSGKLHFEPSPRYSDTDAAGSLT